MTQEEFNEMLENALSEHLDVTASATGYYEKSIDITIRFGNRVITWTTAYL